MVGVDGNFHYPAHLVALLALLTTLSVTNIRAQPVSSLGLRALSGHVYDTRSRPIGGALVIASDALGVGVDSATTDNLGDYHLSIPQEQVLLTVSAIGYATARKIVPGSVTTENVVMRSLVSALAPIRVTASREIRARPADVLAAGTAALENATSGAAGNLAPASFGGNILGKAELVPGMMLQRNATGQIQGVSVLGLSSDQSSVTFDGVLTNNPRIPRDADLAVRVSSSTYDPSRGGFSGAQVEVTTGSGSNISTRYLDVSQSKEVLNRAPTGVFDISGTASGALSLDHIFYSGSMELSEQRAELNSFGSTNSSGLSAADLSHLSAALVRLGLNAPQLSNVQRARTGIALGRLDFVRDTNLSVAVEGHASADAIEPEASSSFVAPTVFGRNSDMDVGISGSIAHYIGESLHESRVGVGRSSETVLPYMRAPTYNIRVLQDGPTLDDRRSVIAGSASDHRSSSDRFTATLEHSVRWLPSSRHYLHAGITSHFTSVRRTPQANSLGRFTFDSVGAFVTGNASSYSRMFGAIAEAARTASVGGFVGDLWIPRPRMSVQLGSRFDADRVMIPGGGFASAPPPILRGAASTQVTSFDLSPRLGMTVDEPISHRFPIAGLTFRGGAGRFVNEPRPEQFLNASIPVTGPHAGSELDCAGITTPSPILAGNSGPDSTGYSTCLGGSLPTPQQRVGYLLSNDWRPASTWRGNVGVSVHFINRLTLTADYVLSRTGRISSLAPVNLAPTSAFVLPLEQNRPVFQTPVSVATNAAFGTGVPLLADTAIGRFGELVSDLHLRASQLLVGAQATIRGLALNVQYAATQSNEETRGITSASGDPRNLDWSPTSLSPHQVLTFTAFRRVGSRVSGSVTGRLQSGIRYTPTVAGDINGDGLMNDRPYIFAPNRIADSTLRTGLTSLLASAPFAARACLKRATGTIIGRNACTGPWVAHIDGRLRSTFGSRTAIQLDALNIAAAVDRLAHGSDHMHGWGAFGVPDGLLYTVTGFDPTTREYGYQVNQSFGSSRATQAINNPFAIQLSVFIAFGRDRSAQQLSIDSARVTHPTYDQLLDRYVSEYPNAALDLLEVADSVALRQTQLDSLRQIARAFNETMRVVWNPVVRAIQSQPDRIDVQAHRIRAARVPAAINYEAYRKLVVGVLDGNQLSRLPFWPRFDLADNALQTMGLLP